MTSVGSPDGSTGAILLSTATCGSRAPSGVWRTITLTWAWAETAAARPRTAASFEIIPASIGSGADGVTVPRGRWLRWHRAGCDAARPSIGSDRLGARGAPLPDRRAARARSRPRSRNPSARPRGRSELDPLPRAVFARRKAGWARGVVLPHAVHGRATARGRTTRRPRVQGRRRAGRPDRDRRAGPALGAVEGAAGARSRTGAASWSASARHRRAEREQPRGPPRVLPGARAEDRGRLGGESRRGILEAGGAPRRPGVAPRLDARAERHRGPRARGPLAPLACGAVQVEIASRIVRRIFQHRGDMQCIGIWVAGLLPVTLYISQVVGTEPLGGLTAAIVALLCVKVLCSTDGPSTLRDAAWIGLALGIALLSKLTALLWVPLVAVAWLGRAIVRRESLLAAFARTGVSWIVAAVVSGWYFARNWIFLGKPIVVGWDWKEVNRTWWQDPGYRIPEHFTRFGRSLVQPVYASVHGFWDGMYSTFWADGLLSGTMVPPPWNVDCMSAGVLFGLPLTAAMFAAMCCAPSTPAGARSAQRFAALAVLLYLLAALDLYLRLPTYSGVKASHTLGLVPFFALLAAAGLRPLLANVWSRAVVVGGLACFGATSWVAYFVRR